MQTTDFLTMIRRIIKLHEGMLKEVCEHYQLALIEANIISFLYNNPRMLAKGNVSQAVESLIQKGLLERRPDKQDRRKIHLFLLPAAQPITREIETLKEKFHREIFLGIPRQEQELFARVSEQMMLNAQEAMKRRETP